MIYHIYRTDCFRSSRVMLQKEWQPNSVFMHKREKYPTASEKLEKPLSISAITTLALRSSKADTFIFHAQSALPYLLIFAITCALLLKKRNVIYDIHDLHEHAHTRLIDLGFRGAARFLALSALEQLCFQITSITKTTVSNGLSNELSDRYKTKDVITLLSIIAPINPYKGAHSQTALVFFGTPKRFPFELLELINDNQIELAVYGKGMDSQWLTTKTQKQWPTVYFYGEYDPSDMSFLQNHKALLLYHPLDKTKNFKYSLPNKFFQALSHGLDIIISSNFTEMAHLLPKNNKTIYSVTDSHQFINAYYTINKKPDLFRPEPCVYSFLEDEYRKNKYRFRSLTFESVNQASDS